jgi:predicted membrane protein
MGAESRDTVRFTPQVILGVCIIVFGIALTADNLGWMDASKILQYWPLVIVAVGFAKVLQSPTTSGRVFGGFLMLVGIALLGDVMDILEVWSWWPIAMIALGLVIITRAFGASKREPVPGVPAGADAVISEFAFWSGVQRRVTSPAFRRADLTAIMGGIEIDFRQAGTAGGEAVIDVFAMWGGIEIRVPPDWAVSNQIMPIMGGAEDKSTGTQASTNRLILRGVAIMGGVEIKT